MTDQDNPQKYRREAQKDLTVSALIVTERTEMDFFVKGPEGHRRAQKGIFSKNFFRPQKSAEGPFLVGADQSGAGKDACTST